MHDNREPLHIAPNKPVFVSLTDPMNTANYDFHLEVGRFETCQGQILTLPRSAVEMLNRLEPKPCEELVIQMHWSGLPRDGRTWTVALSTRSELARAEQEMTQDLAPQLEASIRQAQERKAPANDPTPISRPPRKPAAPETEQPRLFDNGRRVGGWGTGTHGPAPAAEPAPQPVILPAAANGNRKAPPQVIPWNIAFREVSAWVSKELAGNSLQWSDEAQQAMVCTVLIQEAKCGRVGPWERAQ